MIDYYKSKIGTLRITVNDSGVEQIIFTDQKLKFKSQNHPILKKTKQQLDEYFDGKRSAFTVPIAPSVGTGFERSVWSQIRRIPFGRVKSYRQIASNCRKPKAARACGSATGKNPVSILVPCHRVTRQSGDLGGYAWGRKRKAWLLAHEAKYFSKN